MNATLIEPQAPALPGVRLVVRRLRWVLLAAVLGLAAGAGLDVVRTPVYESTAFLTVSSPVNDDPGSIARSTQALARLATSPSVMGEPLRRAGLTEQASDPRLFVSVAAAPDAPIISVTGRSSDAETAQRTTAVVSDELTSLEDFQPYVVALVGTPTVPQEPTTPDWLAPAAGLGVAGGLALVLAATVPAGAGTPSLRRRPRRR